MGYDDLKIESSDKYLKIKAGEMATIHLVTKDPVCIFLHWVNRKVVSCNGEACAICKDEVRDKDGKLISPRKQQWIADIIDRSDGKIKEFKFGPEIAGQFRGIGEMLKINNQTVHDYDFMIKATQGDRISYQVMQCPINPVRTPKEITDNEAGIGHE